MCVCETNKEEDTIAQFYEISADVDEEHYTSCEGSREERQYQRGKIYRSLMGAWWLPAIVMQCGSGVGRPVSGAA